MFELTGYLIYYLTISLSCCKKLRVKLIIQNRVATYLSVLVCRARNSHKIKTFALRDYLQFLLVKCMRNYICAVT